VQEIPTKLDAAVQVILLLGPAVTVPVTDAGSTKDPVVVVDPESVEVPAHEAETVAMLCTCWDEDGVHRIDTQYSVLEASNVTDTDFVTVITSLIAAVNVTGVMCSDCGAVAD